MMHHEFVTCDDCGKQLRAATAPFTVELDSTTLRLCDLPYYHACSTACLVRLATALHRQEPIGEGSD